MSESGLILPRGMGHNQAPQPVHAFKPTWVANTFLNRGQNEGVPIDPLKIQKLVYYMHGWHLAVTGNPAIGEDFEAWPNGPVVSSLYHLFKHFRWRSIDELARDIDPSTGQNVPLIMNVAMRQFYEIFEQVWVRYRGFSGVELSEMTHAEGNAVERSKDIRRAIYSE